MMRPGANAKMVDVWRRLGLAALMCSAFLSVTWMAAPAQAWDRGNPEIFAILPEGSTGPEGLTVGPDGNVYVATFGFNNQGEVGGFGQLFVYDESGKLLRQLSIAGTSPHLLGLAFNPRTHDLLVIDFGHGIVLKVNPRTGASTAFMTLRDPAKSGLNALTFDKGGNVYVSDSFQGIIWKTSPHGGEGVAWTQSPLLVPFASTIPGVTAVPPFGANGLQFNTKGDSLFVANTANDQVIRIPVVNGTPGTAEIFVNSINGADGLIIDGHDKIWVAANQGDEIVVMDPTGKAIAKLGDFNGISPDGTPQGLLFPASLDFSPDGKLLYVTNLALDLRVFGLAQSVDSQIVAQTKRYTISKIRLQ